MNAASNGEFEEASSFEQQAESIEPTSAQLLSSAPATMTAKPLPENQKTILDVLIEQGHAVSMDKLAELTKIPVPDLHLQLTYLELENLIQRESGDRYKVDRSQLPFLRASSEFISKAALEKGVAHFVSFCHEHYHGISRKYLQLYLSQHARVAGKIKSDWNSTVQKLLKHGPVEYEEILRYSSPQNVCFLL